MKRKAREKNGFLLWSARNCATGCILSLSDEDNVPDFITMDFLVDARL